MEMPYVNGVVRPTHLHSSLACRERGAFREIPRRPFTRIGGTMTSKIALISCVVLTAVIVITAARIEQLNILCGHVLPLQQERWILPDREEFAALVERQIARRRLEFARGERPNDTHPELEQFEGPPYTEEEKERKASQAAVYESHRHLHWWLSGMGILQYVLAPIVMLWALCNIFLHKHISLRILNGSCAVLSFGAIFLMFLRDYSITWH